jgi:integrase/recombinase XerD
VAVSHGLRVSEAINLRRRDFSVTGSTLYLTVQRLKGSKRTVQQLNSATDPLFDEDGVVSKYIADLRPNDLLFTNRDGRPLTRRQVNTLIEKYGKRAGIPEHKLFPHALKHTLGILMRRRAVGSRKFRSLSAMRTSIRRWHISGSRPMRLTRLA